MCQPDIRDIKPHVITTVTAYSERNPRLEYKDVLTETNNKTNKKTKNKQ